MTDYEKARAIIQKWSDKARFVGPRPEVLVKRAESALGVVFPPTYRAFLRDFGAGNFGSEEFFGVIDDDWEYSSVPDAIWYTLTERAQSRLPSGLVVVGETGTGNLYAVSVIEAGGPVCIVDPGSTMELREEVASDFGAYLLKCVQGVIGG